MVIFYNKWKKHNEIQLTKNKMDLNVRKMTNHPPSLATHHESGVVPCRDEVHSAAVGRVPGLGARQTRNVLQEELKVPVEAVGGRTQSVLVGKEFIIYIR